MAKSFKDTYLEEISRPIEDEIFPLIPQKIERAQSGAKKAAVSLEELRFKEEAQRPVVTTESLASLSRHS